MPRILLIVALALAGELVFGLPFHTARFFRPTLLDVFNFSNTQLGDIFAVYGVAAMLAYFPGGVLADHYPTRTLITASLLSTAIGGLYMATIPGAAGMAVLYGYWGVTTIFLFWGALIRATREWGGDDVQGLAFGILEGGRGIAAAGVAAIAVNALAFYMPENVNLATPQERVSAFRNVILLYSLVTFLTGVLAWFAIPLAKKVGAAAHRPLQGMALVIKRPIVWAQAGIIICAYCGYKGLDNYSLYAVQVLGMDEIEAATLTKNAAWTRPLAALIAGLIADRFAASRSIGVIFAVLVVSYGAWSIAVPEGTGIDVIYFNFFATYIAVYALRGVYYALLEENKTPKFVTGCAVGLVSLIGYTPDIFFAPIAGRILDADPGLVGHQNYFMFLSGIAALGVFVVLCLLWLQRQRVERLWPIRQIDLK